MEGGGCVIDFRSFVWGLISCALYDFLKSLYLRRETHYTKYSKEYVKTVKIQFYLCSFLSAFFVLIPIRHNEFLIILFNVLFCISLVFAIFAFMCVVDVLNYVQRESDSEDNNSDK